MCNQNCNCATSCETCTGHEPKSIYERNIQIFEDILKAIDNGEEPDQPSNMVEMAIGWRDGSVVLTNDPNTTFKFACDLCGDCCRNNDTIILTPVEVLNISRYLKKSPEEWLHDACTLYIGQSSGMLIARIKNTYDSKGRPKCYFLEEKTVQEVNLYNENQFDDPNQSVFVCGIHGVKPNSCALFPVGRIMDHSDGVVGETTYMIQTVGCQERLQHLQKEVSVFNFLGEFNTLQETSFEKRLNDIWVSHSKSIAESGIQETRRQMPEPVYSAFHEMVVRFLTPSLYKDPYEKGMHLVSEDEAIALFEQSVLDYINKVKEYTIDGTEVEAFKKFMKLSGQIGAYSIKRPSRYHYLEKMKEVIPLSEQTSFLEMTGKLKQYALLNMAEEDMQDAFGKIIKVDEPLEAITF